MKYGLQKEIAGLVGISPKYFNDILHGRRNVSREMATRLETATDISKLLWLYAPSALIRTAVEERFTDE